MQSLSSLHFKRAFLPAAHLDSGKFCSHKLRRGRKRRWYFGGTYVNSSCAQQVSLSCTHLGCGFSHNDPKVSFGERKSSFGRYFAMVLALEKEVVGNGHLEICSDASDDDGGSFEIVDDKEEEEEKIMGNEKNDHCDGIKSVSKMRVDVRALALNLHNSKTADDVEELLKNYDDLPLPVYSSMIRGLGADKKLDAAFAVVEWLKWKKDRRGSVAPNLFIYNSLLSAIKQTEQFDKVNVVLEDMNIQGILPNIVTYNTLMSIYLEQGKPREALNILVDIETRGLSPSPITYSVALLAYKKMDDASGALGFFVKLRKKYEKGEIGKETSENWENEFLKLEKFTISICYLVIRQWLVSEENPTGNVLNLLSYMDETQVKAARTDYERLAWACTHADHYTVARELYRRIRESDSEISLSVCNHVIWLMGKAKKWWAALEVYEDLLDKGPKPNNLSYELIVSHFNILLTAARRRGIWRWGVRLLNKMQDKGLRPGSREWNAVLVACSKASETSAAVEIFRRMVEQGEKPTILSYGALLSALEKGKLYDEALRVWDHMCKVGVKPNLYAYTILASLSIGKGNPEMVDSVIREMSSVGIEPTVVTFNAIITGCAQNNMTSAAHEWFHRMKVRNVKPNEITYDLLIEALARDSKPRLAYEMYLRARDEGLNLSSKTFDAVIESCEDYGASIDLNALGPRPSDKRKSIMIRKNMSDFCHFADLPRREKPFEKTEVYTSHMQER